MTIRSQVWASVGMGPMVPSWGGIHLGQNGAGTLGRGDTGTDQGAHLGEKGRERGMDSVLSQVKEPADWFEDESGEWEVLA